MFSALKYECLMRGPASTDSQQCEISDLWACASMLRRRAACSLAMNSLRAQLLTGLRLKSHRPCQLVLFGDAVAVALGGRDEAGRGDKCELRLTPLCCDRPCCCCRGCICQCFHLCMRRCVCVCVFVVVRGCLRLLAVVWVCWHGDMIVAIVGGERGPWCASEKRARFLVNNTHSGPQVNPGKTCSH